MCHPQHCITKIPRPNIMNQKIHNLCPAKLLQTQPIIIRAQQRRRAAEGALESPKPRPGRGSEKALAAGHDATGRHPEVPQVSPGQREGRRVLASGKFSFAFPLFVCLLHTLRCCSWPMLVMSHARVATNSFFFLFSSRIRVLRLCQLLIEYTQVARPSITCVLGFSVFLFFIFRLLCVWALSACFQGLFGCVSYCSNSEIYYYEAGFYCEICSDEDWCWKLKLKQIRKILGFCSIFYGGMIFVRLFFPKDLDEETLRRLIFLLPALRIKSVLRKDANGI